MKNFFIVFAAVFCAIVVAVVSFSYIGKLHDWEGRRDTLLAKLHEAKEGQKRQQKLHDQFASDSETLAAFKSSENLQAATICDYQTALLRWYEQKPRSLSSTEADQVRNWRLDVAEFHDRRQQLSQ